MAQAITTRFFGPGYVTGSRIIATASGGMKKIFPYVHEASLDGNHEAAAYALAASLGWPGEWHGGMLTRDGAMVWVNTTSPTSMFFKVA